MRSDILRFDSRGFLLLIVATLSGLAASHPASGQSPKPAPSEPRLPGAIEKAPAWLKDAPFDVARFFEIPPAAQNAAPLYLDALYEFGPELGDCYPADRRERSAAVQLRARRAGAMYEEWASNPTTTNRPAIDAVLVEFQEGFRKLELAQRRPRCVFAIGIELDSLIPHAQVARAAVRILLMKISRALDRDEFESAMGDFARIFRLSRDLRPRGVPICQLVSIAIDGTACKNGITPFLAHRKLKVEHCDRLLKLLTEHETLGFDPWPEGVKAEYVMFRSGIRPFSEGLQTKVDADGKLVEIKVDRAGQIVELKRLLDAAASDPSAPKPIDDPESRKRLGEAVDLFVKGSAQDRRTMDDYAKAMLDPKADDAGRLRALDSLDAIHLKPGVKSLFVLLSPNFRLFLTSCQRGRVYLDATRCLIALRRWQFTHREPPTDLAEVCRAAKMPGVPIDPFSGSPLKLALISGEPVVYSVGPDRVDDRGLKDADLNPKKEGDLLFSLPKRK